MEILSAVGARGDTVWDRGFYLHDDVRFLVLFCPFHCSRVLSGVGLVGGNPTMNTNTDTNTNTNINTDTPRLRRGGRIAFSSLFLLLVVLVWNVLFLTQLPSWSDGLYFLNLIFLGTYYIFFASVGTFSGSLIDYYIFSTLLRVS